MADNQNARLHSFGLRYSNKTYEIKNLLAQLLIRLGPRGAGIIGHCMGVLVGWEGLVV
jgi:hypothetical protein